MNRFPVLRDIAERVYSTFIVAVAAAWLTSGVGVQETFQFDNIKTYVGAGILAVFTLAKGAIATQIAKRRGKATSASLDPAVQLQPTGDGLPGGPTD